MQGDAHLNELDAYAIGGRPVPGLTGGVTFVDPGVDKGRIEVAAVLRRLAVEVVPSEETQARFDLRIYWNDRLVHTVLGIKSLTPSSAWPLNTDLMARGSQVDVAFDDYRLNRRKES